MIGEEKLRSESVERWIIGIPSLELGTFDARNSELAAKKRESGLLVRARATLVRDSVNEVPGTLGRQELVVRKERKAGSRSFRLGNVTAQETAVPVLTTRGREG